MSTVTHIGIDVGAEKVSVVCLCVSNGKVVWEETRVLDWTFTKARPDLLTIHEFIQTIPYFSSYAQVAVEVMSARPKDTYKRVVALLDIQQLAGNIAGVLSIFHGVRVRQLPANEWTGKVTKEKRHNRLVEFLPPVVFKILKEGCTKEIYKDRLDALHLAIKSIQAHEKDMKWPTILNTL